MVISFIVLVVTILLLVFSPLDVFLLSSSYIYAVLLSLEWYRGEIHVIDGIIGLTYITLSFIYFVVGFQDFTPFIGVIIYCVLLVMFLANLIGSRPWMLPEKSLRFKYIVQNHRCASFLMSIAFALAIWLSIKFFPDPLTYIFLPTILVFVFTLVSIFLSKKICDLWCDFLSVLVHGDEYLKVKDILTKVFDNCRGIVCIEEGIVVKEVISENDAETFFKVVFKGYNDIRSIGKMSSDDFLSKVREEYFRYSSRASSLLAIDTSGNVVGCARIVFANNPNDLLSLEEFSDFDLSEVKKIFKRLGEVGRLTIISEDPRKKALIIKALMYAIITKAIMRGIPVMFADALEVSFRTFEKTGFRKLLEVDDKEFNQKAVIMYFDVYEIVSRNYLSLRKYSIWERFAVFFYKLRNFRIIKSGLSVGEVLERIYNTGGKNEI